MYDIFHSNERSMNQQLHLISHWSYWQKCSIKRGQTKWALKWPRRWPRWWCRCTCSTLATFGSLPPHVSSHFASQPLLGPHANLVHREFYSGFLFPCRFREPMKQSVSLRKQRRTGNAKHTVWCNLSTPFSMSKIMSSCIFITSFWRWIKPWSDVFKGLCTVDDPFADVEDTYAPLEAADDEIRPIETAEPPVDVLEIFTWRLRLSSTTCRRTISLDQLCGRHDQHHKTARERPRLNTYSSYCIGDSRIMLSS